MEFLNKYNLGVKAILKIIGLGLAAILAIAIIFALLGPIFGNISRQISFKRSANYSTVDEAVGLGAPSFGGPPSYSKSASYGGAMPELSARNIVPNQQTSGDTAEDYEVTEYNGTIKTRELKKTCAAIAGLKSLDYVIFENANEYDTGCNYSFKVKTENKDEILSIVKNLNPRTLVENIHTIKRQIDDYTSEEEILKNKKTVIENTLNNAVKSYDEISKLATQQRDVESLAKIIDSKIRIIEKLSQERIQVNEQLDRLARAKADQLDRINYVYFRLNVYENKFVDLKSIKDSWEAAVKKFVSNMNNVLQAISINLVFVLFMIFQYVLYLLIIILAAKYLWKYIKYIWRK